MPCYACSAEFGILKKEVGCEICGFSFCGRCCKKQEILTETGEKKKLIICNKCVANKSKNQSPTTSASPPLAHKKRMEALKKQSFSVDSGSHALSHWSDDKDKEIAERLQKLKRDRIKAELPTESEIEERIAKLKGMDPRRYKAPPIEVFRPSDRRTSTEKASELIEKMTEEVDLDSRIVKPEDEIAERLAKLRADDGVKHDDENVTKCKSSDDISKDTITDSSQNQVPLTEEDEVKFLIEQAKISHISQGCSTEDVEMTEEEEAEKIVAKFMASNFDDMEQLDSLNDQEATKPLERDDQDSTEEFPWCTICSEDAKIRCFGCEGDLYCLRCFRECHDSLDIKDHQTCPYLQQTKRIL